MARHTVSLGPGHRWCWSAESCRKRRTLPLREGQNREAVLGRGLGPSSKIPPPEIADAISTSPQGGGSYGAPMRDTTPTRPGLVQPPPQDRGRRIAAIDAFRGAAIAAMVVYHAAFDLSARSLIPVNVLRDPVWIVFARSIAGSFLLLVGVGLVLATRNGLKIRPYLRRLGLIAASAGLVSLVTWWVEPDAFVFFGILHQIALASVLALPFLGLPSAVIAAVAVAVIALPYFYASPIFDWPPLLWVGLPATVPSTVDYVPVFPWFGVVLSGIIVGRMIVADFIDSPLARWRPADRLGKAAVWAGRWSLAIYLIHQPILYGLLWAAGPFVKPDEAVLQRNFMDQCSQACHLQGHDDATCNTFCGCMFTNLAGSDLMAVRSVADMTEAQRTRWNGILAACRPGDSTN